MKIKISKIELYLIIASFALISVSGITLNAWLKYAGLILILFTGVLCCIPVLRRFSLSNFRQADYQLILLAIVVFLYSAILQLVKVGTVYFETIKYSLYIFVPAVLITYGTRRWDHKDASWLFNSLFYIICVCFVAANLHNFTLTNIKGISFGSSLSSVFESDFANLCVPLLVYFKTKNENKKALITLIIGLLSFKRLSFILMPIIFVFLGRYKKEEKEVSNRLIWILTIMFTLCPLMLDVVFSREFLSMVKDVTGLDFVELSTGRMSSIWILKEYKPYFIGYGATARFIFNSLDYNTQRVHYFHSDCLSFYWECGIILYVFLVNIILRLGRKNYRSFIISVFLLLLITTTHWLDVPSAMIVFLMGISVLGNQRLIQNPTEGKEIASA